MTSKDIIAALATRREISEVETRVLLAVLEMINEGVRTGMVALSGFGKFSVPGRPA